MLSSDERARLLRVARGAIRDAVCGVEPAGEPAGAPPPGPALAARRGVFVTLKEPGDDARERLRGCLGSMEPKRPLIEAVASVAVSAALHDPRFPPLTEPELERVRISISVLGAMHPATVDQIVVGRHGVQLERGDRRSVFLPQVATEQGWSRERLLTELAVKAGLPGHAWRDATFRIFESEAFAEPGRTEVRR